jgi:hypothetical protein
MTEEEKKLEDFFIEENFNIYLFEQDGKQCAEIEKWTNGGVDMIFALVPLSKDEFIERVNNFDVDEEIDLHRQDKRYKDAFKITESVKDFTDFHKSLKRTVTKLNKLK